VDAAVPVAVKTDRCPNCGRDDSFRVTWTDELLSLQCTACKDGSISTDLGDVTATREATGQPEFLGAVIIEWPAAPRRGVGAIAGCTVAVYAAFTGSECGPKPITTVTRIEIHAPADELVTADLTMFAGEDGKPLFDGMPVLRDGEVITGTFPFIVAEMRAGA
jgi:hypothetical protein